MVLWQILAQNVVPDEKVAHPIGLDYPQDMDAATPAGYRSRAFRIASMSGICSIGGTGVSKLRELTKETTHAGLTVPLRMYFDMWPRLSNLGKHGLDGTVDCVSPY
jgi:hypothetical protein